MSSGLFQSPPPDLAVEIDAERVVAVRLAWRGAAASVSDYAMEPLPAGAVVPSLVALNMADVGVVGRVVSAAVGKISGRHRRAALVVPDTVAKISLIRFERIPPSAKDLMELVRWQVKKSAPFPLEQATVSYTPGVRSAEGGREFIVSMAREDIIGQYEAACAAAGLRAGLVDLATFSIVNSVLAGHGVPDGDWLLVHPTPTYATLAVLRGSDVIFFRNRAEESEGPLADIVHQTAMYYEDRLKGQGFSRVLLAGSGDVAGVIDALRRALEARLQITVENVDPRSAAAITDRIDASPELLARLAPAVGILLRERRAA
jgi:Tfp pilus assembly PilM family ATPase